MMVQSGQYVLKIATVEDSPIVVSRLGVLFDELQRVDYVGNTDNVMDALSHITQHQPDVVILDINLKQDGTKKNGIDLLTMLGKAYGGKVIMFTNLSDRYYYTKCLSLGASHFFDKSNDFETMADTLKNMIHLKQGADSAHSHDEEN